MFIGTPTRTQRARDRHEGRILELLEDVPAARRRGFGTALRRELPDGDTINMPTFIPDAFWIDHENENVVAYEVVNTHRITEEKLQRYSDYWWEISGVGWGFVMVAVYVAARASRGYELRDIAVRRLCDRGRSLLDIAEEPPLF